MSFQPVIVSGLFDDLRSRGLRFLEQASKLGAVNVWLWSDEVIAQHLGKAPKFPLAEREYFLKAVRYVRRVIPVTRLPNPNELPPGAAAGAGCWVDMESDANPARLENSRKLGVAYRVFGGETLKGFPQPTPSAPTPGRKKVIVTGSYDWFHSGHIRFFQEVSAHGDLYVIVGHDANIRLLKGEGHPLLPQEERRYVAGSIRFVKQALISSGDGWMDAAPEIERLQPDIYAVNEDGDKGGKREYCRQHGIEYLVLKRTPAPGLLRRTSTDLRGY